MSASHQVRVFPIAASPRLDRRLRIFMIWAILLLTTGYAFLDYWAYSKVQHEDPVSWQRLTTGQGVVPAQYRIGVYYSAHFLAYLGHLQLRHVFALADFFCLLTSLATIFFLLTRQPIFRNANLTQQWLQVSLGLFLTQLYLAWTLWFQEPETMPSLVILASSALLCSSLLFVPRPMLAFTLLLVALLGSTIRVDAVIAFHAGLLLSCVFSPRDEAPLGRTLQTAIHIAAIALALGTVYYLAHFVFPHNVRESALVQLLSNLRAPTGAIVLLCTLPPWILSVWLARRTWRSLDGWARGLVAGSLIDFAMFFTFGMSEEVRIFLPFMLTLVPISATLLSVWLPGPASSRD